MTFLRTYVVNMCPNTVAFNFGCLTIKLGKEAPFVNHGVSKRLSYWKFQYQSTKVFFLMNTLY